MERKKKEEQEKIRVNSGREAGRGGESLILTPESMTERIVVQLL